MYYHQGGPDIQAADGLQTLYLMNPNYSGYSSDTQPHQQQPGAANMLILNYATTGNTLNVASMASGGQHHLVGVPLHQPPGVPTGGNQKLSHHHHHQQLLEQQHDHQVSAAAARAAGIPHFHQSLWGGGPVDQAGGEGGGTDDVVAATQMGRFHRGAAVVSPTQQGLSLSLSPQQPGYGSLPMDHTISMQQTPLGIISPSGVGGRSGSAGAGGGAGSSSSMSAVVSNGLPNGGVQQISHVVFGSKYLKAAQQLLDELVSVGKGIKSADDNNNNNNSNADKDYNKDKSKSLSKESGETSSHETKSAVPELSTPQKQEIQMKKAKLISMLDEVEQRYKQYHHQMQIVVASFEQATGIGSARSYTQLALQTISKQFRCLKDAISSQIKAASKSLGEELEGLGVGKMEGSRLKFVDQQLRQQRALQHLGMMQNNAWRPQRGLPERAVSVLRAWLFEHFLHPYPKDSDKQMLAKQTGLTRSQVSNWFINARVRLWKPMVEEMYSEEMKNQEEDGNNESNKETGSKKSTTQKENNNNNGVVKMDHHQLNTVVLNSKQEKSILMQDASAAEISSSSVTLSPTGSSPQGRAAGFGLVCALNMAEGNGEKDQQKRLRSSTTEIQTSPSSILSMDMEMKFGDTRKGYVNKFGNESRQTKENFMSLMAASNSNNTGAHGNGFGAFTMGDLSQFNPEHLTTGTTFHGNGVSLTLGLPPSENLQPLSAGNINQHNFLSDHQNMDIGSRLEMGTVVEAAHFERVNKPQATHSSMGYETIDFENSRKRFAAAPLLPDFVA